MSVAAAKIVQTCSFPAGADPEVAKDGIRMAFFVLTAIFLILGAIGIVYGQSVRTESLILPSGSNFILPASVVGATENGGGTGK